MSGPRIVGLVLLVLGVVLLAFGINAANSATGEVTEALTGEYSSSTMWYIIGGIVAGVAGLAMMLFWRPTHA